MLPVRCGTSNTEQMPNGYVTPVILPAADWRVSAFLELMKMASEYGIHPYCAAWPNLPADELKEMADNIKRRGQDHPIYVYNAQVIDGKNRLAACKLAGVEPQFEEWIPSDPFDHDKTAEEIRDLTIASNIRRTMTTGQRIMVAASLVTTKRGDNQHSSGELVTTVTTSQGEAADMMEVSRKGVNKGVKVITEGSKPLVEAAKNGVVTPHDAAQIVDLPKREQTAALKDVEAGRAPTVAKAAKQKAEAKQDDLLEQLASDAPRTVTMSSAESAVIDELLGELTKAVEKPRAIIEKLTAAFQQKAKAIGLSFGTYHGSLTRDNGKALKAIYPEVTKENPTTGIAAVIVLAKTWEGVKRQVDQPDEPARAVNSLKNR